MSVAYSWSGLATLAALLVFMWTGSMVARARTRLGVPAPATTGHPEFERVFRVQMNTLEQIVVFLPALWLAAVVVSDLWAAVAGAVWVVGRVVYAHAYYADAAKRGPGFVMTIAPTFILLILAAIGILRGRLP
ncbi:MAG: MAPEG family protein [Alphaproteobacteria bacterium]|nr:MAPEG family protein [Alphaproteobacteria bacterium]